MPARRQPWPTECCTHAGRARSSMLPCMPAHSIYRRLPAETHPWFSAAACILAAAGVCCKMPACLCGFYPSIVRDVALLRCRSRFSKPVQSKCWLERRLGRPTQVPWGCPHTSELPAHLGAARTPRVCLHTSRQAGERGQRAGGHAGDSAAASPLPTKAECLFCKLPASASLLN